MYVIIGSHFVPLEGKFLLIALVIVRITLNVMWTYTVPTNVNPKSSLERFLNVTSRTSNLHYPYTECKPFYLCQSQPYSHLQKLSYPIDLVRSISVFLNTMAFASICLLFSHYDFLWNVSAVSLCKWCWIVLTYAGMFLFWLNCALMSHKQILLFDLTCLLSLR